jgi:outer membrane protein assembly factor BamB
MHSKYTLSLLATIIALAVSCTKEEIDPIPDDEKEIVALSFKDTNGTIAASQVTVGFSNDTILLTFPYSTDLTHLTPSITIKGLHIEPASDVEQDFSQPVYYTVTAEDSSTRVYVVIAKVKNFRALYFGSSNNHLYAVNPDNGSVIWDHYEPGGYFVYSDPIISNNTLFAGSTDGYLVAFNPATGSEKWRYFTSANGIESPAAVSNGSIYFGGNDYIFRALDEKTGELKWDFRTNGNVSTKPVFYNDMVIFGSSDANVYALNAQTGNLVWSYPLYGMCNQSSPTLHNGVVFIGSAGAYLYAINAADGSLKWKFQDGNYSMEHSTPFVYDGKVYIGSWYAGLVNPGSLFAVDEQTGALVWKSLDNKGFSCNPYIADDRLFISPDDGYLYALNAQTGDSLWSVQIYANGAQAIASDSTVYVGGGGTGYFYAFDAATGNEKWRFAMPNGGMTSVPLLVE